MRLNGLVRPGTVEGSQASRGGVALPDPVRCVDSSWSVPRLRGVVSKAKDMADSPLRRALEHEERQILT